MTQAFNLSQFANNLDSSGRLDATDGLVNAVPVANGGTGASAAAAARTNLGVSIGTDIPSPTGTGASGTWPINITGSAASATTATTATNATNATNATTAGTCTGNAATVTTITTTQVLNATAGASVGAVGTYAFLGLPYGSYGTAMPGATAAGSTLRYSSSLGFDSGGTPSGTWRCMGFMTFTSDGAGGYSTAYSTLWLRIS